MNQLQKEFEQHIKEFSLGSDDPLECPVDLKNILDLIKSKNLEKSASLRGLRVVLENGLQEGKPDQDPSEEVGLEAVPIQLEEDTKKGAVLRELLSNSRDGRMNAKVKFALESIRRAGEELFQAEWKQESLLSKINGLRGDMKIRMKQIQDFNDVKNLISVKEEQLSSLRHDVEMSAEDAERELGVLQCFVENADAKQQDKLQTMDNIKQTYISDANKLGNEIPKTRRE
jgi:hypothetical protein